MKSVTQKFTILCVKQIASGNLLFDSGNPGALCQAVGWDGEGDGKEVWEGVDTGIHMVDSC